MDVINRDLIVGAVGGAVDSSVVDSGILSLLATPVTTSGPSEALRNRVMEAMRKQVLASATAHVAANEATPVVAAKVVEDKPITLQPNQVLFSILTKTKLKAPLHDFAVSTLDISSIPAEVRAFIPTVNKAYQVQVSEAHAILMAWEMNEKVLITGPTGSGKSSLIEYCCALTNRPMLRINMSGDVESSVLFGQLVVQDGATVWKDGPVTEAVKHGAVVLLDEWDVTPPEILFSLQWLFEENGKLFLKEMPGTSDDKFVVPHDSFRLVCAGNTVGQGDDTGRYSGTNVQNNASIDRFQTTIVLNYLEPKHEVDVIQASCKGIKKELAQKMVSFGNLVRNACNQGNINLTMSPRTLINWSKKTLVYNDVGRSLNLAFANKLRETDRKIVAELYQKVFGETL